jgi:hypothetical protein
MATSICKATTARAVSTKLNPQWLLCKLDNVKVARTALHFFHDHNEFATTASLEKGQRKLPDQHCKYHSC